MLEKLRSLLSSGTKSLDSAELPRSQSVTNSENDQIDPAGIDSGLIATDCLAGWSTRVLDGRSVEVYVPQGLSTPTSVILFLHGHGRIMLSQNVVFSQYFHSQNLIAVCPDGLQSWWLDVVSPEFDATQSPQRWLLDRVIPMIGSEFGISPPRIALLGVSMGGQGVLQLAYRHASRFPVVAAISPAVDFFQLHGSGIPLDQMFPDREAARQASVVLNLNPLSWPKHQFFCCDPTDHEWIDGAARLGMKLSSSGILHERDLETSAGGHSWDYFNHMASRVMQHLVAGLKSLTAN